MNLSEAFRTLGMHSKNFSSNLDSIHNKRVESKGMAPNEPASLHYADSAYVL